MKKALLICLAALLMFTAAACVTTNINPQTSNPSSGSQTQKSESSDAKIESSKKAPESSQQEPDISTPSSEITTDEPNEPIDEPIDDPEILSGTLYAVFSEYDILEMDFGFEDGSAPEAIAAALSQWTGLAFDITAEVDSNAVIIDWKSTSSFAEGQPPEYQNEGFEFYDQNTMRWFMLNSLCSSIRMNTDINDVYYSIEGGDLNDLDLGQDFNPSIAYNLIENPNIVIK